MAIDILKLLQHFSNEDLDVSEKAIRNERKNRNRKRCLCAKCKFGKFHDDSDQGICRNSKMKKGAARKDILVDCPYFDIV